MKKLFLLFLLMFAAQIFLKAQKPSEKNLYVIDSIPILTDPEYWNNINDKDIANMSVITNRDSLKMLGWSRLQSVTYIFTKAYRNRPDSIKHIPSLKQMKLKDSLWTYNNKPYTGKYIDYYLNGAKQTEGEMFVGTINGKVKTFFQNGNLKTVVECKNGIYDGEEIDYFRTGQLWRKLSYTQGKEKIELYETFYINGQKEDEFKKGMNSVYDTAIHYYSTGKIKKMNLVKKGIAQRTNKEKSIGWYHDYFYAAIDKLELKQADKCLKRILKLQTEDDDTYFMKGILSEKRGNYEDAVFYYNNVLQIEPMYKAALVRWSLCTIRKHYSNQKEIAVDDLKNIPIDEQIKVCKYLKFAEDIDPKELYVKRNVPIDILNYCEEQSE